ncbi:histidinol-phosphatase HisJ family protein [Lactococcus nasutitermitis]|uniref:Histidinol-phosphatase n=1 Tax=Lactococcus nasutitermitis TaxID=1652957 RepID=A0ABV9JFS2_9LACT|nr:histidinol-phosphatase HisJ family protein [Lactococcus nasutitermitis]
MKKLDYHCHSKFSADSEEEPRNHVLEAISHGLDEICFTEHRDFHFPGELKFDLDVPSYFTAIGQLQEEFAGQLTIKIGLEMGLDKHYQQEIEAFVAASPYDFVIGSVHEIHDIEVYDDTSYYEIPRKEAHQQYFEAILEAITTFDCFDTLAHLDYVARYGPYPDKSIIWQHHSKILEEILQTLVKKNKALEINTRLFQLPQTQDFYHYLLTTFRNYGGEKITLGTDAHSVERDWTSLEKARKLIEKAGFTDLATFTKRNLDI